MISWSGSIEIGVTKCDPEMIELPACATNLCHGTWIMANSCIVHDGVRMVEMYGMDLSALKEGSTLGVVRTRNVSLDRRVRRRSLGPLTILRSSNSSTS